MSSPLQQLTLLLQEVQAWLSCYIILFYSLCAVIVCLGLSMYLESITQLLVLFLVIRCSDSVSWLLMPTSTQSPSPRTFAKVKELTQRYQLMVLADETRRNYFRGNKAFINFCLRLGLLDKHGLIFPSEENLMYFAAHCAGVRGLSPSTIHNYLYGIRSWPSTKAYLIL